METPILTAIIALLGSLLAATLTYWFTKQREREAEWRKEKLAHYKAFIESLSGIVEGDESPEGHRAFARATNNLLLFAPQPVIVALNEFRFEIRISNTNRTQERHDHLLAALLLAIRRDIGVSPKDEPASFRPILWASGAGP
ncbi:MAG: hypothetical protein ACU83N_15460 [Gammaproteobacteria bacterium]